MLLQENGIDDVECTSCGLYVGFGGLPATGKAVCAARQFGADISGHRTQQFSDKLLEQGDLFVGMTKGHMKELLEKYHVPQEKLRALDIGDPYGGDEMEYVECAGDIRASLVELLKDEWYNTGKEQKE